MLFIYIFSFLLLVIQGQTENSLKTTDTEADHSNLKLNSATRTIYSISSTSISSINNENSNNDTLDENINKFETSHKVPDDHNNKNYNYDDVNNNNKESTSSSSTDVHLLSNTKKFLGNKTAINDSDYGTLMQIQKTQNILPTKERPELNPVLSALINEDVMKSIESKRAVEDEQQRQIVLEAVEASKVGTTSTPQDIVLSANSGIIIGSTPEVPVILTTESALAIQGRKLSDDLIDQATTLEEAGTENNQKSRIQIKKGPNGQDYEYEYVYYYYDDDDKNSADRKDEANNISIKDDNKNKAENNEKGAKDSSSSSSTTSSSRNRTKPPSSTGTVTLSGSSPVPKETTTRGKSRYTNIDRSGTYIPENEIVSKAKARSSIPVVETVDEGRLPQITRFPPRSKSFDATPAPNVVDAVAENTGNVDRNRKISVKRPSLELVDSESFNTDEKQVKTNRILDNAADTFKGAITSSLAPVIDSDSKKNRQDENNKAATDIVRREEELNADDPKSTNSDADLESTTPFMEKVAFDLYAILANENLNMDKTTDGSVEATTDVSDSTDDSNNSYTTLTAEDRGETSSTLAATTSTTTTTMETPTTTTTTTTTSVSLVGGRRGLSSSGRNRFRLNKNSGSTTTSTTETPTESSILKTRNRFQRPSFGGRPRTSTTSTVKEEVTKEESKPVQLSSSTRGRTRNRFNVRSTTTTIAPGKDVDDNSVDENVSSTTPRILRGRPTLNIRGRGRPTATTANIVLLDSEAADKIVAAGNLEKTSEEKSPVSSLPTRPSRFNLNRPVGVTTGGNRLLQRSRINPLQKFTSTPTQTESNFDDNVHKKTSENNAAESRDNSLSATLSNHNQDGDDKLGNETEKPHTGSSTLGGLNRLKNRPRINIKTEKPKPQPISLNRKPNPLLARRKITVGGTSTTEAEPHEEEPDVAEIDNEDKKNEAPTESRNESSKDDTTENIEISSEQPRGLGLLGSRRRLPVRKPGTIL